MTEQNGWMEWGRHVLSELERLNGCVEKVNTRIRTFEIEQTVLKVKAGAWGLIAGMIPVAITLLILYMSGGFSKPPPASDYITVNEHNQEIGKLTREFYELRAENEKLKKQLDKIDVRTAQPPPDQDPN